MNYKNKLDKLIEENNGYLDVRKATKLGISSTHLTLYKRENNLVKEAHGLYKTEEAWDDELYVINYRNSKVVFSHETALYLNGLMDREPYEISVTTPIGYNATHLREKDLKVYHVNKNLYNIGITKIETQYGHFINTYDKERTMCDLVKYKDIFDVQIYSTAWKLYFQDKTKDIPKLMRYAEHFNVSKLIRTYLEVIL